MNKLLLHSNAPWAPTGYGNQVRTFLPFLKECYELAISAFYGLEGSPIVWEGVPVFPGLGGEFGGDYLPDHASHHFGEPRDGIVFTLMDVWVLPQILGGKLNLVAWCPVDHEPVPPAVQSFFATGAIPLAMSRFGQEQLADLDPLYCPHGIDTDTLRPRDRHAVRKELGIPYDAMVVGMVAANKGRPSRKGFQQALMAFQIFQEHHDDAFIYLHTSINPNFAQGEDIAAIAQALGIPRNRLLLADQYRMVFDPPSMTAMAKIYSAMDVLLNPAAGEGFGLPIIEAQACGTPVIVTDFSAMKELCGAGWKVTYRPRWTGQNSWQADPDVEDIVEALERCYALPSAVKDEFGQKARLHALEYSAPKVFREHMFPALKEAEQRFEDRKPISLVKPAKVAA